MHTQKTQKGAKKGNAQKSNEVYIIHVKLELSN